MVDEVVKGRRYKVIDATNNRIPFMGETGIAREAIPRYNNVKGVVIVFDDPGMWQLSSDAGRWMFRRDELEEVADDG